MNAQASLSYEDRIAAASSARVALDAAREAELEKAESIRTAAHNAHEIASLDLEAKQRDEEEALSRKLGSYAQERISKELSAFMASGTRPDALATAAAVRVVAAETKKALGEQWAPRGPALAILGSRLWIVAASLLIKKDPSALGIFALENAGLDAPGIEALDKACGVLLDASSTAGEIEAALHRLEDAVARAARNGNKATSPESAAIWDALKSHAARAPLERAFAEVAAARKQREIATGEKLREDMLRAQRGESVEDRPSGWAESIRRMRGKITQRADGALKPERSDFG